MLEKNTLIKEHKVDPQKVRADFPLLKTVYDDKPLVYFDNAATTQKPQCVIDRLNHYYSSQNSTIRRGVYKLSEQSTDMFNQARKVLGKFINAHSDKEIVFTKGCTEAINLIARSYGGSRLKPGDEVLVSAMEHHANIVPWQLICQERGASLKIIPLTPNLEIDLQAYKQLLNAKTKIVSIAHVSNVLGTVNPIKQMVQIAHLAGVPVVVDGAQGAPHGKVDVQDLGCDFYAFSSHKLYGPCGVGVLYGKFKHLQDMPPYQAGGDMIETVSFEKTSFAPPPAKFEAGTPPIAEVIGLAEAINYLEHLGMKDIEAYENELLQYATERLEEIKEVTILGKPCSRASLLSFTIANIHPHDIGTILDQEENIAVRAGHHCAQPLMKYLNLTATTRASFSFYNTKAEIDILVRGLQTVIKMFQ